MNSEYLPPGQVHLHFPGLTADRLARWRWARVGPAYSKIGRQILYRRADIERFLADSLVGTDHGR